MLQLKVSVGSVSVNVKPKQGEGMKAEEGWTSFRVNIKEVIKEEKTRHFFLAKSHNSPSLVVHFLCTEGWAFM